MIIGAATSAAASEVKIFIAPSQAHANQSAGKWMSRVMVQYTVLPQLKSRLAAAGRLTLERGIRTSGNPCQMPLD